MDSIIYLDIDTLFLRPVEELWEHFKSFSAKQVAAMAPEGEVPEIGWYPRFARHPFYGKNGLNSGVMLMNLTRMRGMKWAQKILPIYQKYKLQITWGDQDILNVLFHENPGEYFPKIPSGGVGVEGGGGVLPQHCRPKRHDVATSFRIKWK